MILMSRDQDFLIGLHHHGVMIRDHAWKLFFGECGLGRFNRRILKLKEQKLVVAFQLPLGTFAVGVEGILPNPGQLSYRLGEAGISIVSQALDIDITMVRRRVRTAPTYVGHCVSVAALHVALKKFEDTQQYHLQSFLCESEARCRFEWRENPHSSWKQGEVRPDALAWIEKAGESLPLLLEADMATQNKAAFITKLAGYSLATRTGALQRRCGGSPLRLGVVTTTPARLAKLATLVQASDLSGLHLVALTTFQDFTSQGPLSPIWHIPALGDERNEKYVVL